MAVFTIKLNNTLLDPFINVLVDELNKLKYKVNDKTKIFTIYMTIYLNLKMISKKTNQIAQKFLVLEKSDQLI